MILHNVMWESRPLPKIVRDPLAAHSARGSFFVPALRGIFLFWGKERAELPSMFVSVPDARCSRRRACLVGVALGCHLSRETSCDKGGRQTPADLKKETLAGRETFLEKGSPSPYPSLPKTFAGGPVQKSVTLGGYGRLSVAVTWK